MCRALHPGAGMPRRSASNSTSFESHRLTRSACEAQVIATQGQRINLPGGLPIIVDGRVIGAVGVGSGTGAQDREVAAAGIKMIEGAKAFD